MSEYYLVQDEGSKTPEEIEGEQRLREFLELSVSTPPFRPPDLQPKQDLSAEEERLRLLEIAKDSGAQQA